MSATPKNGSMSIILATGETRNVDLYSSDVANALVNFDGGLGASATSPDYFTMPMSGVIRDFTVVTGMADTTKWQVVINGQPVGSMIRYTEFLDSLNNRPPVNIVVGGGAKITLNQLA